MSDIGLLGSYGFLKTSLMKMGPSPSEVVAPLNEVRPGMPWQKANQTQGYKPSQPEFENVLREMLSPAEPSKQEKQDLDAIRQQLATNSIDLEQSMIKPGANRPFFNYIAQPMNGHYRTELAKNAYNQAMSWAG